MGFYRQGGISLFQCGSKTFLKLDTGTTEIEKGFPHARIH